jgi:hypothetical protein
MSKQEQLAEHQQAAAAFPSDLTDAKWARLEPMIQAASRGDRVRPMRPASMPQSCAGFPTIDWSSPPNPHFGDHHSQRQVGLPAVSDGPRFT